MQVTNPDNNLFVVLSNGRSARMAFGDITHIAKYAGKAVIYTRAEIYSTKYRLSDIFKMLPTDQFFRINRHQIISIAVISRIYKNRAVVNGDYLLISSEYRVSFYSALEKLVNSEYMFYKLDVV